MTTYKEDITRVWGEYVAQDVEPDVNEGSVRGIAINPDPRAHRIKIMHRDMDREQIDRILTADEIVARDSLEDIVVYDEERDQRRSTGPRTGERGMLEETIMNPPDAYILRHGNDPAIDVRLERYDGPTQIAGVDDPALLDDAEEAHESIQEQLYEIAQLHDAEGVGEQWERAFEILQNPDRFRDAHQEITEREESSLYTPEDTYLGEQLGTPWQQKEATFATVFEKMLVQGTYDPIRARYIEDRVKALGGIA